MRCIILVLEVTTPPSATARYTLIKGALQYRRRIPSALQQHHGQRQYRQRNLRPPEQHQGQQQHRQRNLRPPEQHQGQQQHRQRTCRALQQHHREFQHWTRQKGGKQHRGWQQQYRNRRRWHQDESNTIRIGTQGTQKATYITGIYGVPMTGADVVVSSSGRLGVLQSSIRYKRDIQPINNRSQGLWQLRPVTFRYKQDPQERQYGLIAEDVAKVYPELVVRER
jgi:hypothetical protein